jgi:hypothetical protein
MKLLKIKILLIKYLALKLLNFMAFSCIESLMIGAKSELKYLNLMMVE